MKRTEPFSHSITPERRTRLEVVLANAGLLQESADGAPTAEARTSASAASSAGALQGARRSPSNVSGTGSGRVGSRSAESPARARGRRTDSRPRSRGCAGGSAARKTRSSRSRRRAWTAPTLSGPTASGSTSLGRWLARARRPRSRPTRRRANRNTTGTCMRREPKVSALSDERSSHWTSSTATTSGPLAARSRGRSGRRHPPHADRRVPSPLPTRALPRAPVSSGTTGLADLGQRALEEIAQPGEREDALGLRGLRLEHAKAERRAPPQRRRSRTSTSRSRPRPRARAHGGRSALRSRNVASTPSSASSR